MPNVQNTLSGLLRPPVDNKTQKIEDSQNNLEESAEHPPSRAKREGHMYDCYIKSVGKGREKAELYLFDRCPESQKNRKLQARLSMSRQESLRVSQKLETAS